MTCELGNDNSFISIVPSPYMEGRTKISGNAVWEDLYAYSRAVKVGNQIYISGTTATDENGDLVGQGDPYLQTKQIYRNIGEVLEKAGGNLQDVVRVRIYVTDISHVPDIMNAHREFFETIRPAATLVKVASLLTDHMLVEIEADAVLNSP